MSSATSTAVPNASDYHEWSFGITISATATVEVQWSIDNSTWHPAADAVSSSDSVFVAGAFPYMRVEVTSYTSGTVDVDWAAYKDGV